MFRKYLPIILTIASVLYPNDKNNFKYERRIKNILYQYINEVDSKNLDGILNHLTIPIDFHYGSNRVLTINSKKDLKEIFSNWIKSDKSKFHSTKIKSINVQQTGIVKNYLAVADITYDRLDKNGVVIRTERVLYHFILGNAYVAKPIEFIWSYLTRWASNWKIYMISNIDIQSNQ